MTLVRTDSGDAMTRIRALVLLCTAMLAMGCSQQTAGYVAASAIVRDGFARDGEAIRRLSGQDVKLWGYVDHGNLYGDDAARAILGDWWSGPGPDDATWRFNLKANADDAVGRSFPVHVPNDEGRDELLRTFVADASAQRPTKVFVTGRLFTFDAPTHVSARTGLSMEVASSQDILLEAPETGDNRPTPPAKATDLETALSHR